MSENVNLTIFAPTLKKVGDNYYAPSDSLVIGTCLVPSGPVQISVMSISHQQITPVPKQKAHSVRDTGRIETQLMIEAVYPKELVFGKQTQKFHTGEVFITLEQLLRQLELTPFVPIYNAKIAKLMSGEDADFVWAVLQSLRVMSVDEQPGSVAVQMQFLRTNIETVAGGIIQFRDELELNGRKVPTVKSRMYESEYLRRLIRDKISDLPQEHLERLTVGWDIVIKTIAERIDAYTSVLQTLAPQDVKQQLADIQKNFYQSLETIQQMLKDTGQYYDMGVVAQFEAQLQNYIVPHQLVAKPTVFHQYMGSTGWQVRIVTQTSNYQNIQNMQRLRELIGELMLVASDFIRAVPVELKSEIGRLLGVEMPFLVTVDINSIDDQVDSYLVTFQLVDTTSLFKLERMLDVSFSAQNQIIKATTSTKPYLFEDFNRPSVDTTPPNTLPNFNINKPSKKVLQDFVNDYMHRIARTLNEKLITVQLAGQILDFQLTERLQVPDNRFFHTKYFGLLDTLKVKYDKQLDGLSRVFRDPDAQDRAVYQQVLALASGTCRLKPEEVQQTSPVAELLGSPQSASQPIPGPYQLQVGYMWSVRNQVGSSDFDPLFRYSFNVNITDLVYDTIQNSANMILNELHSETVFNGVRNIITNARKGTVLYYLDKEILKKVDTAVRNQIYHQQFCNYRKLVEVLQSSKYYTALVSESIVDETDTHKTLPKISNFGRLLTDLQQYLATLVEMMIQAMNDEVLELLKSFRIDVEPLVRVPFALEHSLSELFTVQHPDRYSWVYDLINRTMHVYDIVKNQIRSGFPGNIDEVMRSVGELKSATTLAFLDLINLAGSSVEESVRKKYVSEPVATDIDTVSNLPPDVDQQKLEQIMRMLEQTDFDQIKDTASSKLGYRNIFSELNSAIRQQQNPDQYPNVLAFNSLDYSKSILMEQLYNLLTISYDIDCLTPNQQIMFIYRREVQPFLFPLSTAQITYNSIQQLQLVKQKDNPIHVASILLTNSTGVIDPSSAIQLATYRKDESQGKSVQRLFLKPGVEIAIRLGYGNNIARLPIVFQGFIQAVQQTNDMVHIVAEGYGALFTRQIFEKRQRIGGLQSNPVELVYQALYKTNAIQLGCKNILENMVYNQMQLKLNDQLATSYSRVRILPFLRQTDQVVNVYQPIEYYKGYNRDSTQGVFKNFETWFCEYNAKPGDSQWKLIQDQVDMMPGYIFGLVDYGIGEQRVFYGRPFDPAKYTRTPVTEAQLSQLSSTVESVKQLELADLKELARLINVECDDIIEYAPPTKATNKLADWFAKQLDRLKAEYEATRRQLETSKFPQQSEYLQLFNPENIQFFRWNISNSKVACQVAYIRSTSGDPTRQFLFSMYVHQLRKLQEVADGYSLSAFQATRQKTIVENTLKQIEQSSRSGLEWLLFTTTRKSLQFRDIYHRQVILGTKPYQSVVPVSSEINLLDNTIGLSSQNIANEVILYSAPFFQDWFFLIRFLQWIGNFLAGGDTTTKYNGRTYTITKITVDDNIPDEYRVQAVEFADYAEVLQQKVLVGTSKLMQRMAQMYSGQLVMLGHSPLKPHDRIILNDSVNNMAGWQVVKNVVHTFDTQAGFVTAFEIEPEIEVRDLHISSLKQLLTRTLMAQIGAAPFIVAILGGGIGQVVAAFQLSGSIGQLVRSGLAKYVPISPSFKMVDSEKSSQQISLNRVVNPIFIKPIMKSGMLYFAGLEGANFNNQAVGISGMIEDAKRGWYYFTEGLKQFGAQFREGWTLFKNAVEIAVNDWKMAQELPAAAAKVLEGK